MDAWERDLSKRKLRVFIKELAFSKQAAGFVDLLDTWLYDLIR